VNGRMPIKTGNTFETELVGKSGEKDDAMVLIEGKMASS